MKKHFRPLPEASTLTERDKPTVIDRRYKPTVIDRRYKVLVCIDHVAGKEEGNSRQQW